MLHLPCSVLSGSHILGLCGVKMLNLRARWILWDNTYSVLWRKRGVIWTSRFSTLMRLACSYKIIDKWTYIIQVVYEPLTLNRSETVQPCYCVPVPRVILSPNPSGCTESAIHEHLKGENWTICHLLKVGPKKHEWCLKYCLGVWDWFHNCFILEVAHHLQNENLNIYCREELKCAHLNVVLFMPPNTVSLIQPFDQGKMKAFKTHFMKACETLHTKETPWWIPGSQSLYVTQLVMLAQSRAASSRLLWKTVGKCLTRLHEKFQSLWRCYRKKKRMVIKT